MDDPRPGAEVMAAMLDPKESYGEKMIPLSLAVDAVLCKLSEAKLGDVLVIRAENLLHARELACALGNCRLPPGALPEGGVNIVVCRPDVGWKLEQK